jgi:hypothetical protein
MGFEGQVFIGAPGATAQTQLLNLTDVNFGTDHEYGDTTVRGTGLTPPVNTSAPVARNVPIDFTMINDTNDANYETLRAAAASASGIAVRLKDNANGKGYDGDCFVARKDGMPLKGAQTSVFTCTPTRAFGRDPNPYV